MREALSRREFLRLSAAGAAAALLAACAPKATETPEAPAEVSGAEPVELLFWNYDYAGSIEPALLSIFDMLKQQAPEITVKYELLPWEQYWQKLNATLAAGGPPDVWYTAPTFYFEYVERGQLVDVSPYVEADPDISEDDWIPAAIDQWRSKQNKHVYGLPSDFVASMVYYNKDVFDAAGVAYPTKEDWTWDDYLAAAKALTKVGDDGTTQVWGCTAPGGWHLEEVIKGNGGEVINDEQTKCLLTENDAAAQTLQYFQDLVYTHKAAPDATASAAFQGMGSAFLTGTVGMEWSLMSYGNDTPFKYSNQLLPGGSVAQVNYGGSNGFVLSNLAQHHDQAYKLAKFITCQAGPILYLGTGVIPVRKDLVESAAYLRQPPPPDDYGLYAKAVEHSHDYYGRGYNEWNAAMAIEFELSYLTGDRSPQESVEAACAATNSVLDKVNQERQAES